MVSLSNHNPSTSLSFESDSEGSSLKVEDRALNVVIKFITLRIKLLL